MKTVKFNEIKNRFNRMSVMKNDKYGFSNPFKKDNNEFVPLFGESDINANEIFKELSEMNPDVILFDTTDEYHKMSSRINYATGKMFGFNVPHGMIDYVDDKYSITFYFA